MALQPKRDGVQTHDSAVRIAQMHVQHGVSGHVATLFPVVVIDANRVLPEFAAGPFFFRSADAYSAEQVARLRGVGPATLETLFARSPPAAIVAGFGPFHFKWNPPMDAALIDYAQRSGFVRVSDHWTINGYRNGQVWVRRRRLFAPCPIRVLWGLAPDGGALTLQHEIHTLRAPKGG